MTASALLVIVLGLISSPFYFFALRLYSIPFHQSGFGVSGTRFPNNKEIVFCPCYLNISLYLYLLYEYLFLGSHSIEGWLKKAYLEIFRVHNNSNIKNHDQNRFMVKLASDSLLTRVPSEIKYCICSFALFYLETLSWNKLYLFIRSSLTMWIYDASEDP